MRALFNFSLKIGSRCAGCYGFIAASKKTTLQDLGLQHLIVRGVLCFCVPLAKPSWLPQLLGPLVRHNKIIVIPTCLALAYGILLSGGNLPATSGQMVVVAIQSALLAFLTDHLGRAAIQLHVAGRRGLGGAPNSQTDPMICGALDAGLQQLPCAVVLVEPNTQNLRFANQAAFQLFDVDWMPASQLTKRRLGELFRFSEEGEADGQNLSNPVLMAAERREKVFFSNLTVTHRDGSERRVSVTAIPLLDDSQECSSVVALIQDVTEYHLQLKQMEKTAYHDTLTGLPNRLSILGRIQQCLDRKDDSGFALLFMDFDRFKLINDSLGHEVGDQLLVEIAKRLQETIRSTDSVCVPARLGGDEFVVLLDELSDPGVATIIAERLLEVLAEPYHLSGHSIVSTASIGVVTSCHHIESAADMLRNADLAMYKSKTDGKARCSLFDDGLRRQVEQRLQLENELRIAVEQDEIDLDIQSIVCLGTQEAVGCEALLRWRHPRLGRIAAGQFLAVASETGIIVPIGDRGMELACGIAAAHDFESRRLRLHVNVSRLQLLLPTLLGMLDKVLENSGLKPSSLVIEVSESTVQDEPRKVIERFQEIKERGIQVCLDNFGSGASPLVLLKELPLDFLKLDRSLVHSVESSPESVVLLEALISIAETYRIQVIAEGIENAKQFAILRNLGCLFGQGYGIQRPVEAAAFHSNCLAVQSAL